MMVASCWMLFVCLAYSASNAHPNSGVGIKDDRPPNHGPSCPKNRTHPRSWRLVLAFLHLFPPGRPARAIPTQISTCLHRTFGKTKAFPPEAQNELSYTWQCFLKPSLTMDLENDVSAIAIGKQTKDKQTKLVEM